MKTALYAALAIYGIAFVISMLVSAMIKLIYFVMRASSRRKESRS